MKGFYMNGLSRYFAIVLLFTSFAMVNADSKLSGSATSSSVIKADFRFIDMEKFLGDIQLSMQAEQEKLQKDAQKYQGDYMQAMQNLEKKKGDMKEAEYKKQEADISRDIQTKMQGLQAQAAQAQQKAAQKAEERMKKLDAIRAKNGWSAIFPTGSALAYDKSLDVTDLVMKELGLSNAACPVKK